MELQWQINGPAEPSLGALELIRKALDQMHEGCFTESDLLNFNVSLGIQGGNWYWQEDLF